MKRKLAAILSADVQGYSRLMGDDEEATIRTLTTYREVMTTLIQQHQGRVVDSPGDNLLAEFASAVDAVQGAVAVQTALKTRNAELPDSRQMHYRIGINVGDVVGEGERIYGDGVNIAARIESLADGGGISVSANVHEQVKNKLDLAFAFQGEQAVKNIADPVRVYRVLLNGDAPISSQENKQTEPPADLPLPDKPSIAVLPFTNMSNDPEQEYFSDGMTDDLITDLSKISGLFIIARNSVFAYKGQTVNIPDVGRALGVRHVLESSVRKAGNQVRINVQLIEAATGGHIWAERYDREMKDIFALQDDVRQKIVRALEIKLTADEQGRVGLIPTGNLEAYDYFLRGLNQMWRITKDSNRQAQQLFEHALALDPEYAAAHAYLGLTHFLDWVFLNPSPQVLQRAFESVQKAISLDDSLPEAHGIFCFILPYKKKQYEQAATEGQRAIALNPNYAEGYVYLGFLASYQGKLQETLELLQKAYRLDPHPSFNYYACLGHAYYLLRRYEEAIAAQKRSLALLPTNPMDHILLAFSYMELGRKEEARVEIREGLRLSPLASPKSLKERIPYSDPAVSQRLFDDARKVLATLKASDYIWLVKTRVTDYFQERRTRDKALS